MDKEYQTLYELNHSVKEDNNVILSQLDKFNKRVRMLEGEVAREQDASKLKDQQINELNFKIQ